MVAKAQRVSLFVSPILSPSFSLSRHKCRQLRVNSQRKVQLEKGPRNQETNGYRIWWLTPAKCWWLHWFPQQYISMRSGTYSGKITQISGIKYFMSCWSTKIQCKRVQPKIIKDAKDHFLVRSNPPTLTHHISWMELQSHSSPPDFKIGLNN